MIRHLRALLVILIIGLGTIQSRAQPIEHAAGVTNVRGTPRRIVALEYRYVEDLLALGVPPVGVADLQGYRKLVGSDAKGLTGARDVGTRQEPSLEAIAALKPDLIIGFRFRHEQIYPQLSAIAPTLLFNYTDLPERGPRQLDYMRHEFETIAAALKRTQTAAEVLAELDATIAAARDEFAAAGLSGERFAFAQFLESGPKVRLFTDHSIAVQLLEETGLENAWNGRFERFGYNVVWVEALPSLGDARFLYVMYGPTYYRQLTRNPVWQTLQFVKERRIYPLPTDTWPFGGPLSAEAFVRKALAALTRQN